MSTFFTTEQKTIRAADKTAYNATNWSTIAKTDGTTNKTTYVSTFVPAFSEAKFSAISSTHIAANKAAN